jgi:hypothetical protein
MVILEINAVTTAYNEFVLSGKRGKRDILK